MKNKKMKVAIYCRVGQSDQAEIEKQKNKIQEYCKEQGFEVFKCYMDNGYSANDKTRPGYNLMLEDMKQKKFDMIITSNICRLHRSIIDFEDIINLIKKHNCDLNVLNENVNTSTSIGAFFIRFLTIFVKLEKELLVNE